MAKLLAGISLLALAAMGWLITMELVLAHPGLWLRIAMDTTVAGACVFGIVAGIGLVHGHWRRGLIPPGAFLTAYSIYSYGCVTHAAHFEGFALLISLLLLLEGVLLLAEGCNPRQSSSSPRLDCSRGL